MSKITGADLAALFASYYRDELGKNPGLRDPEVTPKCWDRLASFLAPQGLPTAAGERLTILKARDELAQGMTVLGLSRYNDMGVPTLQDCGAVWDKGAACLALLDQVLKGVPGGK